MTVLWPRLTKLQATDTWNQGEFYDYNNFFFS